MESCLCEANEWEVGLTREGAESARMGYLMICYADRQSN